MQLPACWLDKRMKARYIFGAILAAALIAGWVHFYAGNQVPVGQSPLQSLTIDNVAMIKAAFNADEGDVRVLVLLSPT
jgi:hypothetical protein